MTRVEPWRYADTPIFRGMLYERDGRFPGTPEGEEELAVYTPILLPEGPPSGLLTRVVPLGMKQVLIPVPMPDSEETQPVPVISLKKA